jgi:Ca2+-binding EF-hand superfamily protein
MKAIIHNPSGRRQPSQRLLLKKSAFLLALALALSAWALRAQDAGGPPPGEDGAPSAGDGPQDGPGMNPPGGEDDAAGGPARDQPAAADNTTAPTSREAASLSRGRALAGRFLSNSPVVGTLTPEARPLTGTVARSSALFPLLAVLDANHDGVIDAGEIRNAAVALKKLDRHGDGKLTREEYLGTPSTEDGNTAGGADRRAPTTSVPTLVAVLDANHDGIIAAAEIANAPAALKQLDRNGDGKLTRDEYEAVAAPPARSRHPTAAATSNRLPTPPAITNAFAANAAFAR